MKDQTPYLVQRIIVRTEPLKQRKGIDRWFKFDYMGSAEFEFDTLPQALKRMRALSIITIEHIKLGTKEVAWFVGTESELPTARAFFRDQVGPDQWFLKEVTSIKETYHPGNARFKGYGAFDGWWAIDMTFCLFKTQQHAELWLKCLKEKQNEPKSK